MPERGQNLQTDGFSERNLRYMKSFYLLYNGKIENLPQVVANSNDAILPQVVAELFIVLGNITRFLVELVQVLHTLERNTDCKLAKGNNLLTCCFIT